MGGAHLVVAIGPDEEEVPDTGMGDEVFEDRETGLSTITSCKLASGVGSVPSTSHAGISMVMDDWNLESSLQ